MARLKHAGVLLAALVVGGFHTPDAAAELRGHGGPVRGLAISADGRIAMSGGFDQSVIVWALDTETATEVLRFHDGAVTAVVALRDGLFASAGEDGRIALWRPGTGAPTATIHAHAAPIAGLAASADGRRLASAAWDETIQVMDLGTGMRQVLRGHAGNVNGVAFAPDGRTLVSAGYDATVRAWSADDGRSVAVWRLPTPVSGIATAPDGEILAAGSDGRVYSMGENGRVTRTIGAQDHPITAVSVSGDGRLLAAAGTKGEVTLISRATGQVVHRLGERGGPAWAVAFTPDAEQVLAAFSDRLIRRWSVSDGTPVGSIAAPPDASPPGIADDDRGARVFRACVACHTVTPDGGNRAGPTLHGVFGRRIATVPGYRYSESLRRMDIVWTAETVSRLFEIGPNTYTPGTKMPEQIIGNAEDRAALVRYLERATVPR
jgi:cytochrome c